MSLFYYQDQNALSKIYLIQIGDGVTIGKISLTIEATNSILVLVVRRCYHTNDLLFFTKITSVVKRMFCIGRTWTKNSFFFNFWVFKNISTSRLLLTTSAKLELGNARSYSFKDGAYYCYCAYGLRISRYSDFLSPMLTNTGIFLRGLKLSGESRS